MTRAPRIALAALLSLVSLPLAAADEFVADVREFGAVGDGKTLATEAIQKAIDRCADNGGGTVRLGPGRWLTGTLYLASNVTFEIPKEATLLGSRRHEDYAHARDGFQYAAILAGSGLENVTVRGAGTIDGQGEAFRDKTKRRPKNLYFEKCRNVTIEGLRLRSSGSWMQHYRKCEKLTIRGIDVFNHVSFNNDGLDVDSSSDVLIEDCTVDSDDDAIVIKSLSLAPCRNVVIRNCTAVSHCNALKFGTESGGGFIDMRIENCTVHEPQKSKVIYGRQRGLAGIALECVDGGTLRNVAVENVRIYGVTTAIFLRLGNRARSYEKGKAAPGVGTFQNVTLRNIEATRISEVGCSITGLPGHPVRDVRLENIKIAFDGGGSRQEADRTVPERDASYPESTMFGTLPAWGFYCRHAEGITFRNVELSTVKPDLRHAMVFDDVERLELDNVRAACATGAAAVLRMTQVDGAVVRGCRAPAEAAPWLLVEGDKTRGVRLEKCDLSAAAEVIGFADGAKRDAVSSE